MELKAHFDRENNIGWSRLLEDAGCHVIYGLDGYKVHSKLCQILEEKDGNVEYTQIRNETIMKKQPVCTDLSLMTADPKIGTGSGQVFRHWQWEKPLKIWRHLLVTRCLQNKVLAMIDEEIKRTKAGNRHIPRSEMNSPDR